MLRAEDNRLLTESGSGLAGAMPDLIVAAE
ncbi:hypothetical protein M2189_003078 [Bradyrhizobium japonicum]|nr:hypothetical protein [Bradyrhizobium japonicum]MCS3959875.1 hypothetical protein [Bradyrhizobium japonicum]MCS4001628.1 hypothetical protein [Bradyrhizobium japonicum]